MHSEALMRRVVAAGGHDTANQVIPALLRTPVLHRLVSGSLMLVTFTGRKTGRRFSTPVTCARTDDGVLFFSNARWWTNLRGGVQVSLRLRGREVVGVAEPVEDQEIVAREAAAFLSRHGVRAAGRIGLALPAESPPDERDMAHAVRDHVVVYVTLQASAR